MFSSKPSSESLEVLISLPTLKLLTETGEVGMLLCGIKIGDVEVLLCGIEIGRVEVVLCGIAIGTVEVVLGGIKIEIGEVVICGTEIGIVLLRGSVVDRDIVLKGDTKMDCVDGGSDVVIPEDIAIITPL